MGCMLAVTAGSAAAPPAVMTVLVHGRAKALMGSWAWEGNIPRAEVEGRAAMLGCC